MNSATVTSKGQITIPAEIREEFGIEPGHHIVFFRRPDRSIGVFVKRFRMGAGAGFLTAHALALSLADMRAATGDAVAEGAAGDVPDETTVATHTQDAA
jgi:antitoxin PrlF